MRIAFQGVHGAYSEAAVYRLHGSSARTIPCDEFDDVFDAVRDGRADRGVIPIENSLAGSIHQNFDLLLKNRVSIVGETHVRIDHVLVARGGAQLSEIRSVRSHPQALAQCSVFLAAHKRMTPQPYFDTAGAARSLTDESSLGVAAISSPLAAHLYGLTILRRHIANERDNYTRFLAISRTPRPIRRNIPMKCSIVFRPARNQVGVLFRILGVFSLRDIDLVKIESRPAPQSPFEYLFYLDLAGSPADENVARALEHLQEMVVGYRLLGAYPSEARTTYAVRRR